MENFEEILRKDLHQFLLSMKDVDERMPECPDVEDKWEEIAKAYIPDGIREFQTYPYASLCWMMYIGMAVAKMWDTEWDIYSKIDDLYAYMRDKRGYDSMDEYIRHADSLPHHASCTCIALVNHNHVALPTRRSQAHK